MEAELVSYYTYNAGTTPPKPSSFNAMRLHTDVVADVAISTDIVGVHIKGVDLVIEFTSALSTPEVTALDGLVSAHGGAQMPRPAPTVNDDSTKSFRKQDVIVDDDGYCWICLDPAAGAANWLRFATRWGGNGSGFVDSWVFSSHIESKSGVYSVEASGIFRGTSVMGVPTAVKMLAACEGDCTGWVRLYCGGQVIAEASFTDAVPTILDMGALSNMPASEDIVEVQLKVVGGGESSEVELYSLHWCY